MSKEIFYRFLQLSPIFLQAVIKSFYISPQNLNKFYKESFVLLQILRCSQFRFYKQFGNTIAKTIYLPGRGTEGSLIWLTVPRTGKRSIIRPCFLKSNNALQCHLTLYLGFVNCFGSFRPSIFVKYLEKTYHTC